MIYEKGDFKINIQGRQGRAGAVLEKLGYLKSAEYKVQPRRADGSAMSKLELFFEGKNRRCRTCLKKVTAANSAGGRFKRFHAGCEPKEEVR